MTRRGFVGRTAAVVAAGMCPLTAASGREWRVAVIGHTGRGDYGHGLDVMWRRVAGAKMVGVADPSEAGRVAAMARLGGVPGFADYRVMLEQLRPEVVAIAPRHIDEHHAMALAAAAAGARGIYIEKPFCRSPREADEIVAACRASGTRLAVAHRNRYHPVLPVVRELVAAGELGTIIELRARGKEDHRAGVLDAWVLGTHVFELAAWLGGPPVACSAMLYQDTRPCTRADVAPGAEGVGPVAGNRLHARFDLADGTPLFFDSMRGRGAPSANFGLQIHGTKGVIDFRIDREPLAHIRRGNPHHPQAEPHAWQVLTSGGVGVPEPREGLAERIATHQAAAEDLLDAIETNRAPQCDAEAGRTTVEMVCAILASHCQDGRRIPMPLEARENALATW